jgi:hypothetical protein
LRFYSMNSVDVGTLFLQLVVGDPI